MVGLVTFLRKNNPLLLYNYFIFRTLFHHNKNLLNLQKKFSSPQALQTLFTSSQLSNPQALQIKWMSILHELDLIKLLVLHFMVCLVYVMNIGKP